MLEEDGAICNKLEEVDEKLENIDECLEDAIKDAIQEGLEMGSDKVLESIDNAIEDFNQKNDGMINSYDNLLESRPQHIPRQSTALDKDADQFSWYAAGNCIFQIQEAGSS